SSLDSAHLRGDPAQDESRQIADGPGSHDPRDHRPPAVSEHDAGKIRKDLTDLPLQSQLIADDDACRIVTGIGPDACLHGRAAVTGLIVCGNGESRVQQSTGEVEVASGMLAQTVDELYHALGLRGGCVQPPMDDIAV